MLDEETIPRVKGLFVNSKDIQNIIESRGVISIAMRKLTSCIGDLRWKYYVHIHLEFLPEVNRFCMELQVDTMFFKHNWLMKTRERNIVKPRTFCEIFLSPKWPDKWLAIYSEWMCANRFVAGEAGLIELEKQVIVQLDVEGYSNVPDKLVYFYRTLSCYEGEKLIGNFNSYKKKFIYHYGCEKPASPDAIPNPIKCGHEEYLHFKSSIVRSLQSHMKAVDPEFAMQWVARVLSELPREIPTWSHLLPVMHEGERLPDSASRMVPLFGKSKKRKRDTQTEALENMESKDVDQLIADLDLDLQPLHEEEERKKRKREVVIQENVDAHS